MAVQYCKIWVPTSNLPSAFWYYDGKTDLTACMRFQLPWPWSHCHSGCTKKYDGSSWYLWFCCSYLKIRFEIIWSAIIYFLKGVFEIKIPSKQISLFFNACFQTCWGEKCFQEYSIAPLSKDCFSKDRKSKAVKNWMSVRWREPQARASKRPSAQCYRSTFI